MNEGMKLHGDIFENLRNAIRSAKRLQGQRVHQDTLQFWEELLQEARRHARLCEAGQLPLIQGLIENLESEIAERPR